MDRNRKNRRDENRIPQGLSFLIWPALLRAPWLAGSIFDGEEDRRRRDENRKRQNRI